MGTSRRNCQLFICFLKRGVLIPFLLRIMVVENGSSAARMLVHIAYSSELDKSTWQLGCSW